MQKKLLTWPSSDAELAAHKSGSKVYDEEVVHGGILRKKMLKGKVDGDVI